MPLLPDPLLRLGRAARDLASVDRHLLEMADGTRLATDVHRPSGGRRHPVVLIRTPYGRAGVLGLPLVAQAKALVAAGYAVVLQDVRGRFGSEGAFRPAIDEAADGARTAEWVHAQPWCDGHLGTSGLSYVGATAIAAAAAVPDLVDAVALGITHSRLGLPDPRGVRHLETTARWLASLEAMADADRGLLGRIGDLVAARGDVGGLVEDLRVLPVADVDTAVLGHRSPIWQLHVDHPDPSTAAWATGDHRDALADLPPTSHVTGWSDLFVHRQLDDHGILQAVRPTPLVVGPWGHLDPRLQLEAIARARAHFDAHLRGVAPPEHRARVWLAGAERWWDLPAWPPPHVEEEWLVAGRRLLRRPAVTATPVEVRYDPADPTPSTTARTLSLGAGRVDTTRLEARPDVVAVTSPPLDRALTVVGAGAVRLAVTADTGIADVAVHLTEVDRRGRSTSLADGLVRLVGVEGGRRAVIDLSPVAARLPDGHRLRLLLAGGAFPAADRNLGWPDPDGTRSAHRPTRMVLEQVALVLPVAT